MNNPLRIIVQEGDNDFRKQIEKEFAADARFALLKSFKSLYALEIEAHLFNADVILLNWHYSTQKLFDFITSSKKNNPETKVLITFDFVQPDFVFNVTKAGANGWLPKPFFIEELFSQNTHLLRNAKMLHHITRLESVI